VRGRILATAPPSGDFLHLFVDDAVRDEALALYPELRKSLIGARKLWA
jgi:hypothetical protein